MTIKIDLPGDEVLNLVEFRHDASRGIDGNQVDALFGGLDLHRFADRGHIGRPEVDQCNANDLFVARPHGIGKTKNGHRQGADQGYGCTRIQPGLSPVRIV